MGFVFGSAGVLDCFLSLFGVFSRWFLSGLLVVYWALSLSCFCGFCQVALYSLAFSIMLSSSASVSFTFNALRSIIAFSTSFVRLIFVDIFNARAFKV